MMAIVDNMVNTVCIVFIFLKFKDKLINLLFQFTDWDSKVQT
jgi:hypothetical protein